MSKQASARKWARILAGAASAVLLLAGCAQQPDASSDGAESGSTTTSAVKTTVKVAAIKGPTGIGIVNLMKQDADGATANDYEVQIVASPEDVVAKVANSEVDIASVPTNLAATLYSKTQKNVQMLAVNTGSVLYILEKGNTISQMADLKGKTIYTTGQGANPEYVLRYLLTQNGLDPDQDVKLEFVSQNDELATLLATGKAEYAMVPEPVVTAALAQNKELRIALDLTELWNATGDSRLLMGCVIARKSFVQEHPEAVEAFLKEYKASVEAATQQLDATAALCEEYGIIPKAAVAKQAIPRCGIVYIDGAAMKQQIEGYYEVLFAANPKSIGGAKPDEAFYYKG